MPDFPNAIWLMMAILAMGGVLSCLHLIASLSRNEILLHDLKLRVSELQEKVALEMKEQREKELYPDLDESAPPPAPTAKPPAPASKRTAHH